MKTLILAIFTFAFTAAAVAQARFAPLPAGADVLNPGSPSGIRWGPEIGLNYNFFNSTEYIAGTDANGNSYEGVSYVGTDKDLESSIEGLGWLAGIAVDIPFSSSVGFLGAARVDARSVSKTANEPVVGTLYDPTSGFPIGLDTVSAVQTIDVNVTYLTIAPAIRFNIASIYGFVGPSFGFPLSSSAKFTSTLPSNDSLYYFYGKPQQSRVYSTSASIPDLRVRTSLNLGVGEYFAVAKKMFLVPEIALDVPLNTINNADARITTVQFILGLRFE